MELLDLRNIANGALQEKVDEAMRRILENLQDPNTPWKVKRQITIKVADGGAWKNTAMANIKEYLKGELADRLGQFTIIS